MGEFDYMFSWLLVLVLFCGFRYLVILMSVFIKNCLNSIKIERNKFLYSFEFGIFILLIGIYIVGIILKWKEKN